MPFAQSILFPVDFSVGSHKLLPPVAAMARKFDARITVLHAATETEASPGEKLAAFGVEELSGIDVARVVVPGPPAKAIVDCATGLPSPMVVLPTHGRSAFRRLLLGSVTASVLHDAVCPVWTSAHCEDGGPLPTEYRSLVCAVDLGPRTVDVLGAASAFAGEFGAQIRVIHSVPGINPLFESAAADRAHAFLIDEAKASWAKLGEPADLEIVEDVGLVAGIAAAVKRHQADLLVIGRGAAQGVLGRLRTNAHDLIRESRCPVLSV